MSKKKKNVITLLVLLVVFVAVIGSYVFFSEYLLKQEETPTENTKPKLSVLDNIPEESITSLELLENGKASWLLTKNEGEWCLNNDEKISVDDAIVTSLIHVLNGDCVTNSVEKGAALSEYGLDSPSLTIRIKTNQKEYRYDLGNKSPVADMGYYALVSSHPDKIYCFSSDFYDAFHISYLNFITLESLPTIEAENMTYIMVDNKEGIDFEAEVPKAVDRVDKNSEWNITAPYEKPFATSSINWNTTLSYFTELYFSKLVDYQCEDLEKYGLADPTSVITIKFKSEAKVNTLSLCVGSATEDGYYYVTKKGEKNVYCIPKATIEQITQLNPFTSMNHCIYTTFASELEGYDVTFDGITLKMKREDDETVKDESENADIWWINGKKVSAEDEYDFLMPYSAAFLLEFSEEADDSIKPESNEPVLTFVYHEGNRDVTVKYLPYDNSQFYRVDKNGMDYFLVDKQAVDDVIAQYREIQKFAE